MRSVEVEEILLEDFTCEEISYFRTRHYRPAATATFWPPGVAEAISIPKMVAEQQMHAKSKWHSLFAR
jgi:hypothetical protein